MLVTTCPGCQTTFRVTEEILAKASGQVRCGRCARIFNANISLREHELVPTRQLAVTFGEQATAAQEESDTESTGSMRSWILRDAPPETTESEAVPQPDMTAIGTTGFEGEPAGAPESDPDGAAAPGDLDSGDDIEARGHTGEPDDIDEPDEVDEVDETNEVTEPGDVEAPDDLDLPEAAASAFGKESAEDSAPDETDWPSAGWLPALGESVPRRRWPLVAGAALLALTLAIQVVHHFRATLAEMPGIGTALVSAYTSLDMSVAPSVDLDQYATLDLTAVAEPVAGGQGWLVIETRIQNRGPRVQPFPYIFVSLIDRWQETIAGRYFAPDEYIVTPVADYARMNIGSTVDAQFIIVDPGPDATGFELEFCAPVRDSFSCETDIAMQ